MPPSAILAALRHAERTGEGQHIDMALLDTQVAMLANLGANYLVSGKVPGRAGNAHQNIVPYQVFEVAPAADGSKDHMILAVGNDGQFAKFCQVAGRPELAADPRFARNQDRVRNRAVLVPLLEAHHEDARQGRLAGRAGSGQGAVRRDQQPGRGVRRPAGAASAAWCTRWQHPLAGAVDLVASPIKLSATPVRTDLPPPLLGQHTRGSAGASVLGWDDERIAALRAKEVI